MVFMSRLAKVTLLYMMIDLVSDSINWNMSAQRSGPVMEWIECAPNISGVRGSVSSGKPPVKMQICTASTK